MILRKNSNLSDILSVDFFSTQHNHRNLILILEQKLVCYCLLKGKEKIQSLKSGM